MESQSPGTGGGLLCSRDFIDDFTEIRYFGKKLSQILSWSRFIFQQIDKFGPKRNKIQFPSEAKKRQQPLAQAIVAPETGLNTPSSFLMQTVRVAPFWNIQS